MPIGKLYRYFGSQLGCELCHHVEEADSWHRIILLSVQDIFISFSTVLFSSLSRPHRLMPKLLLGFDFWVFTSDPDLGAWPTCGKVVIQSVCGNIQSKFTGKTDVKTSKTTA